MHIFLIFPASGEIVNAKFIKKGETSAQVWISVVAVYSDSLIYSEIET